MRMYHKDNRFTFTFLIQLKVSAKRNLLVSSISGRQQLTGTPKDQGIHQWQRYTMKFVQSVGVNYSLIFRMI